MNIYEKFINKFEIPLTLRETNAVFDNIKEDGGFLDSKLVQSVYMPVYYTDGGSGRAFSYPYDMEGYYELIKEILKYKEIVITYPEGKEEVIEKYYKMGVKSFMVSKWKEEYKELKNKYSDLYICRSIVGNAYEYDNYDERFDAIVVPYKDMLDIEKIKEVSKKVDLVVIANHFCKPNCKNLDNHCYYHMKSENLKSNNTPYVCPEGKDSFIPREVLYELLPYIKTVKMIGRTLDVIHYENYINYYVFGEPIMQRDKYDYMNLTTINKYNFSNMKNMNCRFECDKCNKKCY